jgi:cytochrome c5
MRRVSIIVAGWVAALLAAPLWADGKAVYESKCAACHAMGIAGAPKFGDKAAWEPRLKTGQDALMQSVIKGKNAMPPRAGQNVSDKEIKEAVEYMTEKAK